jgi:hypothetical protein
MIAYPDCSICKGTGTHIGGDEEVPCSTCILRARTEDRIRAVAEASVEGAYRDSYAGMSPIEAWNADGNR